MKKILMLLVIMAILVLSGCSSESQELKDYKAANPQDVVGQGCGLSSPVVGTDVELQAIIGTLGGL